MQELSDVELLGNYAHRNSDEAFSVLVTRHVDLVYSTALRKTGNPHAAEEITQAVFIILAKKAGSLRDGTFLSSWLYQTTRLTAQNFLRSEIRRTHREQEAYMESLSNETEANVWNQIEPHLEDAMGQLSEKDRNAIALRFFEGKSFQEVGNAFGASENAAKKRVGYALEKLRKFFARRGVVSSTAIIATVMAANSVQSAPTTLATSVSAVAITKGAAASGSTLTLVKGGLKLMAWTKAKIAAVGACVLLTAGTTTLVVKELVQHAKHTDSDAVKVVAEFDWKKMAANRQLLGGEVVQLAGQTVLKIHETNKVPTVWNLFNIQAPPITAMNYAITGEIKYDGVAEDGYLATWNYFSPLKPGLQESQYYSYTGDLDGPQKKINGSSDWRTFSLPLDRATGNYSTPPSPPFDPATTAHPPTHINVSSFLPGGGLLYLRNVKLTQWTEKKKMTNRIDVSESK